MGNKLRNMLDPKDNGLALTMNFKSFDDRQNFIDAIDKMSETGVPQAVPVPQFMELKKTKGQYQYPFENVDNIARMMVYPAHDIVEIPVIVDGAESKYSFLRMRTNEVVFLNSLDPSIVEVKLELKTKDNIANFTYKTHPGNADTVENLILAYKHFLALLDVLFQKQVTVEKLGDIRKYFDQSVKAYIRAKQLSEVLKINLTPKKIVDEDDKDCFIEKTYLLLVDNSIIRQDDKLNHIEIANIESLEEGRELFAIYSQKVDLEIFGERREFYTVNCIFGAEISKVERNEDGNNVVYFKESEKNPMYRAYSAFLEEKDAEKEIDSIMDKRDLYERADSWVDQLQVLLQS